MAQLIKVALFLIVACVVRAIEVNFDCFASFEFTNDVQRGPIVEEFMYRIQYGSTVNFCFLVNHNSFFPRIDVDFYNPKTKELFQIVDTSRLQADYVDDYSFNFTVLINGPGNTFTINTLTPLTDKLAIIVDNSQQTNTSVIIYISGYNALDSETKYLTSNNTNRVPISFGNEVKLYCQGFSDTVYVVLTNANTFFDLIVLNSEVSDEYSDEYSFERIDFNAYVLTIKNLIMDGKYTCIDGESTRQEAFDIVISGDLTINPVHFGKRLIYASFPYGSRLNLYCHDIPSNDVEIYVIGLKVVGNSAVFEEYDDYYEFSVLSETTTVFTIKDLTSLPTHLIKCFDKNDIGCASCSKQFIVIEGFNLLNATTKYEYPFGSFDVVEPYGSEVTFYFWVFSYKNLSIIMTDKYGNTTDILDNSVISAEYLHQFCYAPSILNHHVFTIKNVTEDLNSVQIEFVVDGFVLWTMFNITGFQVDEFKPPRCFDQMGFEGPVSFHALICISSQAEGEISYTLDVNGNVTDITDRLIDLNSNGNPTIKQLTPRDYDITTGRVYCHVDNKLPGDYPPVRKSCLFKFNAN